MKPSLEQLALAAGLRPHWTDYGERPAYYDLLAGRNSLGLTVRPLRCLGAGDVAAEERIRGLAAQRYALRCPGGRLPCPAGSVLNNADARRRFALLRGGRRT